MMIGSSICIPVAQVYALGLQSELKTYGAAYREVF